MGKKYRLAIFFLPAFLLIFIANSAVMAKVYIDIDAPGFQQFPIAICDFQYKKANEAAAISLNTALTDKIRQYLDLSGIFNLLDKKSFLEG
ncbi:MAG: hypothetical protein WAW22_04625, partial [Smithellaceae bacterium]